MNQYETMIASCAAFATKLAECARNLLIEFEHAPLNVELKTDRSFVTAMDARIETELRIMISARWPEHGIIGEEEKWSCPRRRMGLGFGSDRWDSSIYCGLAGLWHPDRFSLSWACR